MTVWTISADHGTLGHLVARELSERVGVPLLSVEVTQALADAMGVSLLDADAMEQHLPGRLHEIALSMSAGFDPTGLVAKELRRPMTLRTITEDVIHRAANEPCVIVGRAGFVVLADHPTALHVRIWAPQEWRVEQVVRLRDVSHDEAHREVRDQDHARSHYVHRLYGRRLDDSDQFHLRIDARRFSIAQMRELIAAGGEADVA